MAFAVKIETIISLGASGGISAKICKKNCYIMVL